MRNRISRAAAAAGRQPEQIRLIAVSKTFPAQAVCECIASGQRAYGENYAQEGVDKILAVESMLRGAAAEPDRESKARHAASGESALGSALVPPEWHFIGPIQSNKTRLLAEHFDWVQSIDRLKVAQRLADQRPLDLPPLQVCVQVNISGEATKSGVAPSLLSALVEQVAGLRRLTLRGLMALPEPTPDSEKQRDQFRRLRELKEGLVGRGFALDTLSMGMSDDLEAAVAEGATMVRVGRAIFGERR